MCQNAVIQNGKLQPYNSKDVEKYWEVVSTCKIKYKGVKKRVKFIYSVKKLSDGDVFTLGDTIALTWYETFSTPHIIKEFIVEGDEIYLRYDETSMWVLCNTRKVGAKEISNAIDDHCQKQK